jgi:hypothetical protein
MAALIYVFGSWCDSGHGGVINIDSGRGSVMLAGMIVMSLQY